MLRLRGKARWICYGLLVATVIIIMAPFLWVLLQSFKFQIDIFNGSFIFTPTLSNYVDVLMSRRSDFPKNVLNSVIVASVSTTAS